MCETCDVSDPSPVTISSMVVDVGVVVTKIFPDALVWIPPSANCCPVGLGLGLGLGLATGEGVVAAAWEVPPQATADAVTSISSAIARLTRKASIVHRSGAFTRAGYWTRPRLRPATGAPLSPPPHRAAEPPPHEIGEAHQQEHRADRAKARDQVVDGGHEVVRSVAESGGKSPVVVCGRRCRGADLSV